MDSGANEVTFTSTREGAGSCPVCRYELPPLVESAPSYFKNGFVKCGNCGGQVDLWHAALDKALRLSIAGAWALTSLGAGQTTFVMSFETGKFYSVELQDHGLPARARILKRGYTGQGGDVTAMEWHGNAPPLRFPGTVLRLVGVPLGEGPLPRVGPVSINIVWIRSDDSDAWPYLVTAFEAAAAGEFAPAMVFAQSAVEISLMPLIKRRLTQHASAERVKHFMGSGLTYGYALNIVLPYMCAELGACQMPDNIRGALNRLRDKRNNIIHEGSTAAAVSSEEAMEGLCAASFGFEFMRHTGPLLSKGDK